MTREDETSAPGSVSVADFRTLMQTIADGWSTGDACMAAGCYAENAVYSEPPDRQLYVGHDAFYRFFGGDREPAPEMRMVWRHLIFDESKQVGAGEYTFEAENQYHGGVMVRVVEGKIANWREYQYRSALDWPAFIGLNAF
jgi:SnoaL-like protein